MRKLTLILALSFLATAAEARPHHHTHHARHHHRHHYHHTRTQYAQPAQSGRPSDCYGIPWCGCYLRHVFGIANTALNLARAWAHVGSPTSPSPGAVVVWPHHVGVLVAPAGNGRWVVKSGNDGNAVRVRERSIAGAIAFRRV